MSNTFTFQLAGDGLWGAEAGRSVTITGFSIDYYVDPKSYEIINRVKKVFRVRINFAGSRIRRGL